MSSSPGIASWSKGHRSGPQRWLLGMTMVAPFSFVVLVKASNLVNQPSLFYLLLMALGLWLTVTQPSITGWSTFRVW